MIYRALADAVVIVHLGFILFIALGGFLVWRWRRVVWPHVAAVAWGVAIVVIGFDCPLTPLEKFLRDRGGERAYRGGFIDRYVEGVIYPERYTPHVRALVVALVLISYARLVVTPRRTPGRGPDRDG